MSSWWSCPRCARSTRVVCDGALREQGGQLHQPPSTFSLPSKIGPAEERIPWLASTARIERAPLYRARSASKEATTVSSRYPHTLFNTSRYASSIFPKSFRNRSLSIDSFVV